MKRVVELANLRFAVNVAVEGVGVLLCFALLYVGVMGAYLVTVRA